MIRPFLAAALVVLSLPVRAATLQDMAQFAQSICGDIPSGSLTRTNIQSKVQANAGRLAKIISGSTEVSGQKQQAIYQGVPFDKLPDKIPTVSMCKIELIKTLLATKQSALELLFSPPPPPPTSPNCPDSPGRKICKALAGHHILDVLLGKPNTVWVLTSEPASGPVMRNPDGAEYPTRKVSLMKISSLHEPTGTYVTKLPITEDGIIYLNHDSVNVFLIYRVGDDADYLNSGTVYTFNKDPLYELRVQTLFKFKNWGGFPMFVDGHLKYFSYDGYYWVIDDQPDGNSTPKEAEAEWKAQEAEKSFGVFPAHHNELVDGIIDVVEKYLH